MGISLCSASPVSEPNFPSFLQTFNRSLLASFQFLTELFPFHLLSQNSFATYDQKWQPNVVKTTTKNVKLPSTSINMELFASYNYTALAAHFNRDDVALKGFAKFFQSSSDEERDHADKVMKYQALRGGRVVLQAVNRPSSDEWDSPLAAMEYVLKLEKEVNQALLEIHALTGTHNDPHLAKFLEDEFLEEQAESIHQIAKYIAQLTRVGEGVGVHIFDKELQ